MLKVSTTGGTTRASFEPNSRLNVANAGQIKSEFLEIVRGNQGKLVVDLSNLDYIDSSGVGALLSLLRLCKERGWDLTLASPQPGVKELFNLLQLYSIFKFV